MSLFVAILVTNFIFSIFYLVVLSFQIQSYLKKKEELPSIPSFAHSSNGAAMLYALNYKAGTSTNADFERSMIAYRRRYFITFAFALASLVAAMVIS